MLEKDSNQIHCEDELTLQKLLDEELDADANELVFHHLKGCARCAAIFQELKETKSLCESQLGLEDEIEAVYAAALLARVRSQVESTISQRKSMPFGPASGNGNEGAARSAPMDNASGPAANKSWRLLKRRFTFDDFGFRFSPGVVTAIVVTIAAAITAFFWLRTPITVSAAQLLRQSAAADEAISAHADQVLRRSINLEARIIPEDRTKEKFPINNRQSTIGNDTMWRRRIEIWQSANRGLMARRLFDDKDRLIAGEWKKVDGSRVLFREGTKLENQSGAQAQLDRLTSENIWLLDVSAREYSALIENVSSARVGETPGTYVIRYDRPATEGAGKVVSASLVLSKADLHSIEQTIVISPLQQNGQAAIDNRHLIEYRFAETSFERRTPSSVAPAVFEPDPPVLAVTKSKNESAKTKDSANPASPLSPSPLPFAASPELEVEVLEKLNRVNAFLGEQLSLTRTSEGKLLISGIVDTPERKNEILRSLGDAAKNPSVRIDVNTVAEAQRQQQNAGKRNLTVQDVQVSENTIPVDGELRRLLIRRGVSGDQLDREIEQLSRRVLAHSARARSHALALKQIAERFSAADLERMNEDARSRWRALILQHAQFFRREMQQVRQELESIFPAASVSGSVDIDIADDKDLARAAKRLFELVSVTDNGLHRSFSLSSEGGGDAPVRSQQFWRSFANAESVAGRLISSKQ